MTTRVRSLVAWATIAALTIGFGALSVLAQSDGDQQLFTVEGIDAPIVASEDVSALEPGSTLVFERIALPPAAELPVRTTTSPELYYVQAGEFSIQDDFGFGTTVPAGTALTLNAGTTVTLANQGAEPAVVLRLRISGGAPAASDAADGEATPVDLTAGTTQGADEIAPTMLVQMPVSGLSLDSGQIFLSRATFSPGSATGEQGHAGPIGIYVETGALNVVSPSGFQGTIGAGQGVSLPAATPLQASTVDAEAVVLIVGLGAADAPFGEVTPEPVAATEVATEVAESGTPEPTPTPGPTPLPTPTPIAVTEGSLILQSGETWRAQDASMNVQVGDLQWNGVVIQFTYRNLSDSRVDFLVPEGFVDVHDDLRAPWNVTSSSDGYTGTRIILDPGESFDGGWRWAPDDVKMDTYTANVFVTFRDFGAVSEARWGFTVADGRILTLPPDAIDPTASGQGDNSQTQTAGQQPGDGSAVAITDIHSAVASLSPPDGLAVKEQGSLGADQITATFSDPAAASRFFNDWGWQENAFVYYEPPNGGSSADGIVYVDVGLHRFASADGASQALTYFADTRRDQMRLGDVEITPIGGQSRALIGPTDMGTEASVYSRVGAVAIRVSVMSVGTDPLAVAIGIAQGMGGAPQASAAPSQQSAPVDLMTLLPGAGDVPAQLVVTGERNRTLAEVAENYVNPADTTALFTGWGWQGNVTRAWQLPSGANVELTQINGVYVSIHAFDNPQGAAAALDLSLVDQSALTGAWEVGSPGLGDYSRALWGQETYGNEITLLVQRGNVFIRVSAAQLEGDPTPVAAGIVQGIISRAG